ncbi:hypothetical protein AVEN_249452-1, partial [Araneus ventricosus]
MHTGFTAVMDNDQIAVIVKRSFLHMRKYGAMIGNTVDGIVTLGENIADNGGVRNAFKAFRLHLALSGEELNYRKRLPGLSASPEQLFFLGYASIWCANMTHKYAMGFTENDNHSPNKI